MIAELVIVHILYRLVVGTMSTTNFFLIEFDYAIAVFQ